VNKEFTLINGENIVSTKAVNFEVEYKSKKYFETFYIVDNDSSK
jgi:hypothetical protein